ncbi:MAG: hypothetical protein OEV49_05515 [candidate division Zixibacteria bacterium]|nr:hypothetical protein [candidate division Zixibacteria bacterium]MDH3936221.1 hypothetical protein [candidate division Zixibacteria bacterium]MDH4032739.1 hypothetical protein [candidate division Zixibacteria bacterium]
MEYSIELAKVCGAFRSNRWGNSLEGEDYSYQGDSIVIPLPELLRVTRSYVDDLKAQIEQENPHLKS